MAQKCTGQWTMCSNIPNSSSSLIFLGNQRFWVWSPIESPICGPSPDPPTTATCDLKKKINGCREKMVFEFGKIHPWWETVLFGVTTYFIFLFLKWGKSSKNKNTSMTPVKKKRSTKLDFWVRESGYLSARYLMQGNTLLSPKFGLY